MPDRLENYRKMQRELDYLERKTDKRLMSETRARWKAIHKAMRNTEGANGKHVRGKLDHWQEDRAVAAGGAQAAPGEESPNSAGQCAG